MNPDPAARFVAAVIAHAAAAGVAAAIVAVDRRAWASATFIGERQRIILAATESPARVAWLAALPEATFAIPRHLVADLVVVAASGSQVTLEALLLEAN
jgi:hypothetical protein